MKDRELSEEVISALLDGELDADERTAVEARLAESPTWRAVLAEVGAARDAVRALPAVDPPSGFVDRLLADAPARGAAPARSARRRSWPWAVGGAVAAASVLAAVVVPDSERVEPPLATFVDTHGAATSVSEDPISSLAPLGVPTRFEP